MKTILIISVILIILWTVYSIFISRAEQMSYTLVVQRNGYEIRKYDPYIAATVQVDTIGRSWSNQGFRILAGYIFGGNTTNQSIAMTAPVTMQENLSESIAMTAPVMAEEWGDSMKMTFSMPKKYTLATLPKANDSRIAFTEVPAKTFAVYKFGWYYSEKRIRAKKVEFIEILKKENVKTQWEPIFAGYNWPGTIPFLVRNEILVELSQ